MKKIIRAVFYAFTTVALLAACKDNKKEDTTPAVTTATLKISYAAHWQGNPYVHPAVVEDNFGNQLRIDKFMSYVSKLSLIKEDGSEYLLKDYSLIDFLQSPTVEFKVPAGHYTGLKFLIGVPADVNTNTDPAPYPSDHVLSVAGSQGMFWTWATGYIFTKLEGKADTTASGQPLLYPFAYHTGDDHYSRYAHLQYDLQLQPGAQYHKTLIAHVDRIFSPVQGTSIDLSDIGGFHSPGPAMATFVNNFSNAFTLE